MRTHIEYDDFGEYLEALEDVLAEHIYQGTKESAEETFVSGKKIRRAS